MAETFFGNKSQQDVLWKPQEIGNVMQGSKSPLAPNGGSANPGSAVGYKHGGSGTGFANEQQGFVGAVQPPAES